MLWVAVGKGLHAAAQIHMIATSCQGWLFLYLLLLLLQHSIWTHWATGEDTLVAQESCIDQC